MIQRIPEAAIPVLQKGVPTLGEPAFDSPLLRDGAGSWESQFQADDNRIVIRPFLHDFLEAGGSNELPLSLEMAGPRRKIFFDPKETRAAIVTCGGLCPGINDVIRRIVLTLYQIYGLKEIYGVRYGYRGLVEGKAEPPLLLRPDEIEPISNEGGSFLGTSRGNQNPIDMVDFLQRREIRILFTIGGDGTQRGALAVAREAENRGYPLSVIGLPKTIDSDIGLVEKTFGFDTAVSVAADVLRGAHMEAEAEENGVVIVQLMGRNSGFLATHASIASGDVNFVLIPEAPFELEGPNGFLEALRKRIEKRKHALVVVAEGVAELLFGKDLADSPRDPSGNPIYENVGSYLKDRVSGYFEEIGSSAKVRFIDPSYLVRSLPAIAIDSVFCQNLAHNAVHAALSGRTRMLVATCHGMFCHFPLEAIVLERRFVDLESPLWRSALETTGQPPSMK